jgi:membrane protein
MLHPERAMESEQTVDLDARADGSQPVATRTGAIGARSKRRPARRLVARTITKAWDDSIFSMSATAAFWQALSLPPLFLALLGSLSYVSDWFGPVIVRSVEQRIIGFSERIFNSAVVDQIIAPTAENILTGGRADVVSVGFILSLWAGSSAVASIVDSITQAHSQYDVRHPVVQRALSLLIYLVGLVVSIIGLPLLALGPGLLPQVLPEPWRPVATSVIDAFYYPVVGLLIAAVLTTLYKIAVPRVGPWYRLLPGAVLAMVVFLATATGLRIYIAWVTSTGYTYGALATPIAFLLFAFLIGFAIILGAYLNHAIEEIWPSRPTRRQRRLRRLDVMRRLTEKLRAEPGPEPVHLPGPTPGVARAQPGGSES